MTMQGWVTRNRLREEQEQAKIEQARKEGFDDGYIAGKTFAGMGIASATAREKETEELRAELDRMRRPLWVLKEEHDAEIATLRAKLEAGEKGAAKWVKNRENEPLEAAGWHCVGSKWAGADTLHLMIPPYPPVPLPETKP